MSDPELSAFLAFAHTLADAARAEILPRFRTTETIDKGKNGAFDPVTAADRGAEAAMRALIEAAYPDHGIVGEEYGEKPARSAWSWTLDPIDGTRAFICGVASWGTLIALTRDGVPVIGVIDQGYLDERYVGWPGGAKAIVRGTERPLRTRSCPALPEAVLATTDPFLFNGAETGGFDMLRHTVRMTRYGLDCYAYAMLADGRIDLVVESGLKRWDVHALEPVIVGAGGAFVNWRGDPAWQGGQVLALGDASLKDQALVALTRAATF